MTPPIWSLIKGFVVIGGISAVLIVLAELRQRHSFQFWTWLRSKLRISRPNSRGPRLGKLLRVSPSVRHMK